MFDMDFFTRKGRKKCKFSASGGGGITAWVADMTWAVSSGVNCLRQAAVESVHYMVKLGPSLQGLLSSASDDILYISIYVPYANHLYESWGGHVQIETTFNIRYVNMNLYDLSLGFRCNSFAVCWSSASMLSKGAVSAGLQRRGVLKRDATPTQQTASFGFESMNPNQRYCCPINETPYWSLLGHYTWSHYPQVACPSWLPRDWQKAPASHVHNWIRQNYYVHLHRLRHISILRPSPGAIELWLITL